MTEQQILELIMSCGDTPYEGDVDELLLAYVERLALLSNQISRENLLELMAIGVGIYHLALREFQAGVDAHDLLEELRKKRNGK